MVNKSAIRVQPGTARHPYVEESHELKYQVSSTKYKKIITI